MARVGNRSRVGNDIWETGHRLDLNPGHTLKGKPPTPRGNLRLDGVDYSYFLADIKLLWSDTAF